MKESLHRLLRPKKLALVALVLSFVAPLSISQDNLPNLGRANFSLTELDEEKLGRSFIRTARRSMRFISDPELTGYLTELGNLIALNGDEPSRAFYFYLIEDDALNAFAVPGGHIAVNTGLIMATQSEAELASVIAHEIVHITQHHIARMIERAEGRRLPMIGAVVAAILLGGQAGQAALVAANAGAIGDQLKYSRSFEREADSIGIQTLVKAGFDPRAMPSFFERLQRWSRIYESGAPSFLRTHPLTVDRIADSAERAESYPRVENRDQSDFFHARARIRAYSGGSNAAAQFASNLDMQSYVSEAAERYGYALALSEAKNHKAAREQIDRLLLEFPDNKRYQIARANVLLNAEKHEESLEQFEQTYAQHPKDRDTVLNYASALVQMKLHAKAKDILKYYLLFEKSDPFAYSLLGRAQGELGDSLSAHQSLSEYFYLRTDLPEAYRQLRLAERYAGDSEYAMASIEARIKEIQREMIIYGENPRGLRLEEE